MSTMREAVHVGLCGNMRHGWYTLHSAGEDACAPMSNAGIVIVARVPRARRSQGGISSFHVDGMCMLGV